MICMTRAVQASGTGLAIPYVGRLHKAGAEDVDSVVTTITVHGFVFVVDGSTDQAWLVEGGQIFRVFVVDDDCGIQVGLLLLVLDDVRRVGGRVQVLAQLDTVELGATDGTTVCSLYPWSEA